MEIFIYVQGHLSRALDEFEDEIDLLLHGSGEVTGSGTGTTGSNIDVLVKDGLWTPEQALANLQKVFHDLGVPNPMRFKIDGQEFD